VKESEYLPGKYIQVRKRVEKKNTQDAVAVGLKTEKPGKRRGCSISIARERAFEK
jgi:hypothetical protein